MPLPDLFHRLRQLSPSFLLVLLALISATAGGCDPAATDTVTHPEKAQPPAQVRQDQPQSDISKSPGTSAQDPTNDQDVSAPDETSAVVANASSRRSSKATSNRTTGAKQKNPQTKPQPPPAKSTKSETLISNVTLRNQTGQIIYQGDIDLQPVLNRIQRGEKNQHRNDGTVFQNREGRLPKKTSGYYHEYVVPTPNQSGPGPQRLILGQQGETYYTFDHYKTFKRLSLKFTP